MGKYVMERLFKVFNIAATSFCNCILLYDSYI